MDFAFDETTAAVRELARKIFKDRVTLDRLREIEARDDRFDAELWRELAKAGLLETALPGGDEGDVGGYLQTVMLLVEAGYALAPIPLLPTLVLGATPIAEFGTNDQRARLLSGVATGEILLTAALSEAGSGDALRPATTARAASDGWLLEGTKSLVPAAHLAHRILVTARVDDAGAGLFLVDPRREGVELVRENTTSGDPQFTLSLRGVIVGRDDRIGGEGVPSPDALQRYVHQAQIGLCAIELGIVRRALRLTAQYTSERIQFDRPIATFQAVAHRAADAYIDVETIWLTTLQAAWRLSQGLSAQREVAIAKYWAAEAGHRVAFAAQHLHGGIGYDMDYPLGRYYLKSREIELTLGCASEQLAVLGRAIAQPEAE